MNALRKRTAELLDIDHQNDPLGRLMDYFLIVLIIVNVIAIILESVDSLQAQYGLFFRQLEVFSVAVFTVEFILRLWSCVDLQDTSYKHPVSGRIRYLFTPAAMIDLLAIAPFYLSHFFAIDLRFLRVIRILRIFKLTRYSAAMQILLDVVREEARALGAAMFILFLLLVLTSSGIYLIEHEHQPDTFGSIPEAMWWSMATLTTVGYGDVTPITPLGKIFGGIITVIGMGMVALPTGILASGFSDQLHRRREEYRNKYSECMEDGILTPEEQRDLEQLKEQLNLNDDTVNQIVQTYIGRRGTQQKFCSNCGAPVR